MKKIPRFKLWDVDYVSGRGNISKIYQNDASLIHFRNFDFIEAPWLPALVIDIFGQISRKRSKMTKINQWWSHNSNSDFRTCKSILIYLEHFPLSHNFRQHFLFRIKILVDNKPSSRKQNIRVNRGDTISESEIPSRF